MRVPKATHLALMLLVAAGFGACAASAQAQSATQKKSSSSKSRNSSHRTKTSKKSQRRERGQKAPTPDRISEIQQALAQDRSYTGKPSGKWDDSTMEATIKFQKGSAMQTAGRSGTN